MKRGFAALAALAAIGSLVGAPAVLAQQQHKPDMHMHKSELTHRPDQEVAAEYKTEAEQLREKAKVHRDLAAQYRMRTPHKSGGNYASVAKHCDKLAKSYESAAKAAFEESEPSTADVVTTGTTAAVLFTVRSSFSNLV